MFGTTLGSTVGNALGVPVGVNKPLTAIQNQNTPERYTKDVPRAHNYVADYGGCGYWRLMWPSMLLSSRQEVYVHDTSTMVMQDDFYRDIKCVRIQRQVAPHQLKFFNYLAGLRDKLGFRICYEIDDVFIYDDIPVYNKFREAYKDPGIRDTGIRIMSECDEVTVTCQYMKEYYKQYTENVTIIPNYPPKFWMDRYYDDNLISKNYDRSVKKRKKPRILYAASGAHFDVDGRAGYNDDFVHVRDVVRKTVNKFQWVFVGAFPMQLKDLVRSGKIEFHRWVPLPDYPSFLHSLKANIIIAPLIDNTFNRCKSNIKHVEANCLGLPSVCQDLVTYKDAEYKFTTGDDLIDNIDNILKDKDTYMKASRRANTKAQSHWLEDHLDAYKELYTLGFEDNNRKQLNDLQV